MTDAQPVLVLASQSPARAALLRNTGLDFIIDPAHIDERAVEKPLLEADFPPADIAQILADTKAAAVSERHPGLWVIGADQVLAFKGERLTKPESMEAARRQLLALRAETHTLHAGLSLCRDGEILWRHQAAARMTMRDYTPHFIGRYLAKVGETALQSVGAYQLEGPGIQLFAAVDGDYFTVLGLPLLPLLDQLRRYGAIDQ